MWSHTDIKILHMNHNHGDNQNKQSFMLQCMMGVFIVYKLFLNSQSFFVLIVTVVVIHVQNLDICM